MQDETLASSHVKTVWAFCRAAQDDDLLDIARAGLDFIHFCASGNDSWLAAVGANVLPKLYNSYEALLVAFRSDTESKQRQNVPGRLSLRISWDLQQSIPAIRFLSSMLDITVDCCDLDEAFAGEFLLSFVRATSAILMGSNFSNRLDERSDEAMYQCDALRRNAAFSMANIAETSKICREGAVTLYQARHPLLMKVIQQSPEISIQRSLLRLSRLLYDHKLSNGDENKFQENMDKFLFVLKDGTSPGSSKSVSESFQEICLSSEGAANSVETFRALLCALAWQEDSPAVLCTTIGSCHVFLGKKASKKGAGYSLASIDWNIRGISIRSQSYLQGQPMHFSYADMANISLCSGEIELEFSPANSAYGIVSIHFSSSPARRLFKTSILPRMTGKLGMTIAGSWKSTGKRISQRETDAPDHRGRKSSTPAAKLVLSTILPASEDIAQFSDSTDRKPLIGSPLHSDATGGPGKEVKRPSVDCCGESAFAGLEPDGVLMLPALSEESEEGREKSSASMEKTSHDNNSGEKATRQEMTRRPGQALPISESEKTPGSMEGTEIHQGDGSAPAIAPSLEAGDTNQSGANDSIGNESGDSSYVTATKILTKEEHPVQHLKTVLPTRNALQSVWKQTQEDDGKSRDVVLDRKSVCGAGKNFRKRQPLDQEVDTIPHSSKIRKRDQLDDKIGSQKSLKENDNGGSCVELKQSNDWGEHFCGTTGPSDGSKSTSGAGSSPELDENGTTVDMQKNDNASRSRSDSGESSAVDSSHCNLNGDVVRFGGPASGMTVQMKDATPQVDGTATKSAAESLDSSSFDGLRTENGFDSHKSMRNAENEHYPKFARDMEKCGLRDGPPKSVESPRNKNSGLENGRHRRGRNESTTESGDDRLEDELIQRVTAITSGVLARRKERTSKLRLKSKGNVILVMKEYKREESSAASALEQKKSKIASRYAGQLLKEQKRLCHAFNQVNGDLRKARKTLQHFDASVKRHISDQMSRQQATNSDWKDLLQNLKKDIDVEKRVGTARRKKASAKAASLMADISNLMTTSV